MSKKKQVDRWKNRIVGSGEMPAAKFAANPLNARTHPKLQQAALVGSLTELGWIQNVIVNKTTGNVVDGHARIVEALKLGGDTPVPYVEVELSEAEERLALATLDPISAMAGYDKAQLDALLRDVNTGDAALQTMLAELAQNNSVIGSAIASDGFDFGNLPQDDRAPFQQMTFTLHDSQVEIVKDAIKKARQSGDFEDSPNKNGNGNALALICEVFLDV